MMVIYLPVKFEFDWIQRFRVRVRKQKSWRTNKWTNKKTELEDCSQKKKDNVFA